MSNLKRKRLENRHKFAVTQCKAIAASFGVIDIVSSRGTIVENVDATEARDRQSSVSSLDILSLSLSSRHVSRKKHSDPNSAAEKRYHALTVSAGAHVMSCPALSDPARSPKNLPRSPISPRYSINNSILTILVSEISLVLRTAFTFTFLTAFAPYESSEEKI